MRQSAVIVGLAMLIVLVVVACTSRPSPSASPAIPTQPPQATLSPPPSPTSKNQTYSATPTLSIVTSPESQQVTTEKVHRDNFWWSDDQTLHYSTVERSSWWTYNVKTGTARMLEEKPLRPGNPSPKVLSQIPDGAKSISASPSREKTLYILPLLPTPTARRDAEGETEWVNNPSELWLREDGTTSSVGSIEACIKDYLWSDDEKYVVARSWTLLPCQAYAWLVDLEALEVKPLVLREEEWLEVIDLSPSGQKVLIRSRDNGRLYALDVTSLEPKTLNLAQWAWGEWLDDRYLIVGENQYPQGARWSYNTFWLYDAQKHERTQLLGANMSPALVGLEFAHMSLSPDRRWLAFTADQDIVGSSGKGELWVAQVRVVNQ